MAQQLKDFDMEMGEFSSVPGTHTVEEGDQPRQVVLCPLHSDMCVHTLTQNK